MRWMEEEQRDINCYSAAVDMAQGVRKRKKAQTLYDLSYRKWYNYQCEAIEMVMKLTGKSESNALAFIASNRVEILAGDYDWTE